MSTVSPVRYRYYTTDLLSNQIISEIPFKGVNYEKVIRKAGAFSGNIPFIQATAGLDLYEATMPGRTGLYIMRNDVCVWGGIIWGRSYDAITKQLTVDASEFTSYLYHRNIWQTLIYGSEYYGVYSYEVSNGIATITTEVPHGYSVGTYVAITFTNPAVNGSYEITEIVSSTSFRFASDSGNVALARSSSGAVRSLIDTYTLTRDIIERVFNDFAGVNFANEEIEPAKKYNASVISKRRSNGVVTLKTQNTHDVIPGQEIQVVDVDVNLNGNHLVTEVPDNKTIIFEYFGNDIPLQPLSGITTLNVLKKGLSVTVGDPYAAVATIYTDRPHGLSVGQVVYISNVDPFNNEIAPSFDGRYVVASVPNDSSFTYSTVGVIAVDPNSGQGAVQGGTVSAGSRAIYGEYGGFSSNSDIDISFSTPDESGYTQDRQVIRGFEMKSVGEFLEQYSDNVDGFEYRIDCEYDYDTASFKRIFNFIPLDVTTNSSSEETAAEILGANKYTFEYPGNILTFNVKESAEDAATRMFVVGNISDLADDISQPYAAASDKSLLNNPNGRSWPVLDQVETLNDVSDEETLFRYASDYLYESKPPIGEFTVTVNGSLDPLVGSYYPGDWCALIVSDEFVRQRLASDQEPRSDIILRKINSFKVAVPDNPTFPETVDLQLITDWKVDNNGQ